MPRGGDRRCRKSQAKLPGQVEEKGGAERVAWILTGDRERKAF